MSTAGGYKIVFRRQWHQPRPQSEFEDIPDNNGRYDTVCEIWEANDDLSSRFVGVAKLHPKDKLNKVLGKKIALLNAMIKRIVWLTDPITNKREKHIEWYFSKQDRTEIWKAFWVWVKSWNEQSRNT